jgi:hypothetical protein
MWSIDRLRQVKLLELAGRQCKVGWCGENRTRETTLSSSLDNLVSRTIIRGTLKAPNSQLVTPISIKLQRPDGCD